MTRSTIKLTLIASILVIAGVMAPPAPTVQAMTISVAPGAVAIAADGQCSLIEAIVNANTDAMTYADCIAGSGADVIDLVPNGIYTLTVADNSDGNDGPNGLPMIASSVTIDGHGAVITRGDGAPNFRIFFVQNIGVLTLNDITVSNGNPGHGLPNSGVYYHAGGIYNNDGTVSINNSLISGNSVLDEFGGGILNGSNGSLIVTDSTFAGNSSANSGGGIMNSGILTVTNSTFSDNSAALNGGGGIYNGNTATVTNSTFSGNRAPGSGGGGIMNGGFLTVTNSTFSDNSAASGGGIVSQVGTITLRNSIIANSTAGGDCVTYSGTFNDGGNNIVEDNTCGFAGGTDPKLGPLRDNGGPTETMALLTGSPAINAANPDTCPTTDQRGHPRLDRCDIGAFEFDMVSVYLPLMTRHGDCNGSTCLSVSGHRSMSARISDPTAVSKTIEPFATAPPFDKLRASSGRFQRLFDNIRSSCLVRTGIVTTNVVPSPYALCTSIDPPMPSI
jgi:hypothetical protein